MVVLYPSATCENTVARIKEARSVPANCQLIGVGCSATAYANQQSQLLELWSRGKEICSYTYMVQDYGDKHVCSL